MIIDDDPICAIITPPGIGAINVIRVSGKNSIEICDKVFKGKIRLTDAKSHTIHYGIFGDNIDDVLVSVFKSPNSYTGEDSVEISCHGSSLIAYKIVELLCNNGTRLAKAGEFTKRAFINGKIDLIQAEAVAELIRARSDNAIKGARNQMDGLLSKNIKIIKEELIEALGLVELELDFAEENFEFIDKTILLKKVENILSQINKLISTYKTGKTIFDGIHTAIVGTPNVGKSSLLNCLLKDERAIVSPSPGTTRDIISEDFLIEGYLFKLYDTAGLRESAEPVEEEGIRRAKDIIRRSDLIIHVNDIFFQNEKHLNLVLKPTGIKVINVINKIDLMAAENFPRKADFIYISTINRAGIDDLINEMICFAKDCGVYSEETSIVSNIRQLNALSSARDNLSNAKISIEMRNSEELIAIDLRRAIDSLKELIGEVTSEEVLNSIFSKFCIGK